MSDSDEEELFTSSNKLNRKLKVNIDKLNLGSTSAQNRTPRKVILLTGLEIVAKFNSQMEILVEFFYLCFLTL